MRPRFANRGSDNIPFRLSPYLLASMRPRFANRGSHAEADHHQAGDHASMRPRFANRGSVAGEIVIDDAVESFNEAPIRESGK